ncbi:hypothetical protein LPJ62_005005 [Coemansia sp. RSA 2167]|nr:hypothetical protein LPJ62_005005 [Coemansia sp. RSA 2167]
MASKTEGRFEYMLAFQLKLCGTLSDWLELYLLVDSILRSRLAVEDRALKRCLRQLSTMCARQARLTPEEAQQASKRVLQEVRWFRHTVQVAVQSQWRCQGEIGLYADQQEVLEGSITGACSEIERLSDSLEESRNHKRHKIAYDEIAIDANKRLARDRLAAEIDEINSEIEQLEQEEASHDAVTQSLHTQYAVVTDELNKLASMSKSALSMQDLGIYLGDADIHAEKAGSDRNPRASTDMSPAAHQHHDDPRDGFDTPIDSAMLEDTDAMHSADDHSESEEGEEEGEHALGDNADQTVIGSGSEEEGECEDEEGELLG